MTSSRAACEVGRHAVTGAADCLAKKGELFRETHLEGGSPLVPMGEGA